MSWNGRLAGTPLVVDNFSAVHARSGERLLYLCTHAHKDHTVGLTATWSQGTIYCSAVTRALLLLEYGNALEPRLRALELEQTHCIVVDDTAKRAESVGAAAVAAHAQQQQEQQEEQEKRQRPQQRADIENTPPQQQQPSSQSSCSDGFFDVASDAADIAAPSSSCGAAARSHSAISSFNVVLLPSNHCPGSCMFLFTSPSTFGTILATGDFRYDASKFHFAALQAAVGRLDRAYFDATYLLPTDPRAQSATHAFPTKATAVAATIKAIESLVDKHAVALKAQEAALAAATGLRGLILPPEETQASKPATHTAAMAQRRPRPGASMPEPGSAPTAPPRLPPELDWRVYLSCEGLGSEELLESLVAHFGEPLFVDCGLRSAADTRTVAAANSSCNSAAAAAAAQTHAAMSKRFAQLSLLCRLAGRAPSTLVVNDPSLAGRCHLHLVPSRQFQQFAQRVRAARAEAKREWLLAAVRRRIAAAGGADPAHAAAVIAAATHAVHNLQAPATMFLKPSTQWWVLHSRGSLAFDTSANAGGDAQTQLNLPLASSYLARGAVRFDAALAAAEQASLSASASLAPSSAAVNAPSMGLLDSSLPATAAAAAQLPVRADDRWGVTHILWSMHSCASEIRELLQLHLRARAVTPICVPVALKAQADDDEPAHHMQGGLRDRSAPSSAGAVGPRSAAVLAFVRRAFESPLPASSAAARQRAQHARLLQLRGDAPGGSEPAYADAAAVAAAAPVTFVPLVLGTDVCSVAASSALAVARASARDSDVARRQRDWDLLARAPVLAHITDVGAAAAGAAAAAAAAAAAKPQRSHSSPVKAGATKRRSAGDGGLKPDAGAGANVNSRSALLRAEQYGVLQPALDSSSGVAAAAAAAAAEPPHKRIRLDLPPSPLDALHRVCDGSSSSAMGKRVQAPAHPHQHPLRVPASLIPFNPRSLGGVHVWLERDIGFDLRLDVAARLARLGCEVQHWQPPARRLPSADEHTAASAAAGAAAWSPHTRFILIHGARPSSLKLLLPSLVRKVQQHMHAAASARDWVKQPLFICSVAMVRWLEVANGLNDRADMLDEAVAQLFGSAHPDAAQHITFRDVCLWNTRSQFQPLMPMAAAPQQKAAV